MSITRADTPPQHPLIEDFRPENTDVDSERAPSDASVVSSDASLNGVEDHGSADMAIWSVGSMDRVQLQDASSPLGMDVSFEKTIDRLVIPVHKSTTNDLPRSESVPIVNPVQLLNMDNEWYDVVVAKAPTLREQLLMSVNRKSVCVAPCTSYDTRHLL